jgi:import inner membrane translocase subunit TIM9
MEALNQAEQQELQQRMEKRQMKGSHQPRPLPGSPTDTTNLPDFMGMYSKLVDKCFNDCVDDFSSKSISSREEGCVMRCWDKNMKGQERIQQRFVIEAHGRMY